MANDSNSGDKTEKATPKRLKDARKKGDVAKSKDFTNTLILVLFCLAYWQLSGLLVKDFEQFMSLTLSLKHTSLAHFSNLLINEFSRLLITASAWIFLPIVLIGVLGEFAQAGPIFTIEKMKPNMEHLNPAAGLKRMFSMDSLFELLKSVLKTCVIFFLAWLVAINAAPRIAKLPFETPQHLAQNFKSSSLQLTIWTCVVFLFVAALDIIWQKHSFARKMKMSRRDIKQEHKDMEGDPQMKSHRKQTALELAQQGATHAAGNASVLVVNPTHIAVAIHYDKLEQPVPIITAMGEMDTAVAMREAAEEQRVPILRNQQLARTLLANTNDGDFIPRDLFDIVAEVILWAQQVQEHMKTGELNNPKPTPGEDLTNYSDDLRNYQTT